MRLVVPQRGEKRGLVDLARATRQSRTRRASTRPSPRNYDALETLRAVLELPALPRRIECFDISTIQGSETVASMVVCEDGRMKRSEYRKFRIRGPRSGCKIRNLRPRTSIPNPQRLRRDAAKSCCAAIASCSRAAGRFPI